MPGPGSTTTKSTTPKKSSSFNLFGRRKKKEEKAAAAQQQDKSASPPSTGRKRSNALTPAQAREAQEMLKRQRELEQAERAHKVMVKRSWFEDQMRQRETEKEEEQERERAEKEKATAERAHKVMVRRSQYEDLTRRVKKGEEFEALSESIEQVFDKIKTDSDSIKGTTHTVAVQGQMKAIEDKMDIASQSFEKVTGEFIEVRGVPGVDYDTVKTRLEDKKKSAEEAKAAA